MRESLESDGTTVSTEDSGEILLPNPIKSEHLREGEKPIMTCVVDSLGFNTKYKHRKEFKNATNVDYSGNRDQLLEQGMKVRDLCNYVISPVDTKNKYTFGMYDCVSLVVSGRRSDGEYVSFLLHRKPGSDDERSFTKDLKTSLSEIKALCEEGTLDAVIVGGVYFNFDDGHDSPISKAYINGIQKLGDIVSGSLGFEPVVVGGPKIGPNNTSYSDAVLFKNGTRQLYLVRNQDETGNESFVPSQVDSAEVQDRWNVNERLQF